MEITPTKTVRELAVEVPGATRLFEKLGIDYCCGGAVSLETACAAAGLSAETVVSSLEQLEQERAEAGEFNETSLTALISYILNKHHVFTRQELDRLDPLLEKVCAVYEESRPELRRIQSLFRQLKSELLLHMQKEEAILFPYISEVEDAVSRSASRTKPFFGTVRNPVRMMMSEHDAAGDLLREIRDLSLGFSMPEGACVSFQTLYRDLEALERDLHQHIHLENNILFPRAVDMESAA